MASLLRPEPARAGATLLLSRPAASPHAPTLSTPTSPILAISGSKQPKVTDSIDKVVSKRAVLPRPVQTRSLCEPVQHSVCSGVLRDPRAARHLHCGFLPEPASIHSDHENLRPPLQRNSPLTSTAKVGLARVRASRAMAMKRLSL